MTSEKVLLDPNGAGFAGSLSAMLLAKIEGYYQKFSYVDRMTILNIVFFTILSVVFPEMEAFSLSVLCNIGVGGGGTDAKKG